MRFAVKDKLTGFAVFLAALCVFVWSPVTQMTDSRFALLVSDSLLQNHSFTLDAYNIPRADVGSHGAGVLYQLHEVNGHIYYLLPPGTSVLSVPYLAVAKALGYTVTDSTNAPDAAREERLQLILASLLMALWAAVMYGTARLLLPHALSITVALGAALSTQVWSTASRALWAHTWNTLLWSLVVWLVLRGAVRGKRPQPVLLATILAWTYFVRPTSALGIIAVTVYYFWTYRAAIVPYAITGAAWAGLFGLWSKQHYGTLLPEYYQAGRLDFSVFGTALAGHLFSPSRGLLVYVPLLWFLGYLLARYRKALPHKPLAWLAVAFVAGQLFSVAAYPHWWGGAGFGPRFLTDLASWFVLLTALALAARRTAHGHSWELVFGFLLLALGMFINGRGACARATWQWNNTPRAIDRSAWRLWSWREPQFLAGLVESPLPPAVPQLQIPARIDFTSNEATPFLWTGWSDADPTSRWNDGKEALVLFDLPASQTGQLAINLAAFVLAEQLTKQAVTLELNGAPLGTLELKSSDLQTYEFTANFAQRNQLRFKMPNATAPASLTTTPEIGDHRLLAVRVAWVEVH